MSLDLAEDTIIIFTIWWDKPRMTWGRGKPALDTKIQKTQILQWKISHKWETSANTSSWRSTLTNPSYSTWLFPQPWPSTSKGCPILFRIVTVLVFQIVTFTLNSHTVLKVLVQVTTLLCCPRLPSSISLWLWGWDHVITLNLQMFVIWWYCLLSVLITKYWSLGNF